MHQSPWQRLPDDIAHTPILAHIRFPMAAVVNGQSCVNPGIGSARTNSAVRKSRSHKFWTLPCSIERSIPIHVPAHVILKHLTQDVSGVAHRHGGVMLEAVAADVAHESL